MKKETQKARRNRLLAKGVCPRHQMRPLAAGKTICQECIEAHKASRDATLSRGTCQHHRGEKLIPGRIHCHKCVAKYHAQLAKAKQRGVCRQHTDQKLVKGATCIRCSWGSIKYLYGLSPDDWRRLWKQQNGQCGCCHVALDKIPSRQCHVDHCHTSNTVRGLLCNTCNLRIAHLERILILGAPDYMAYLARHKKDPQ